MPKDFPDLDKMIGGQDNSEIVVNDFNEASAQDFRERMLEASEEDPGQPIVIYIDSYGGSADALAKMIETMDEIPNPTVTVAMGKAMSCGAILLSHGDMRFCGKHSRVMIHEVSGGTGGDVHDINADATELKRLNKRFLHLFAKNCNIKGGYDAFRKMIKDRDGRDLYMDADEAKAFGVVDAVGIPRIHKVMTYQLEIVPDKPKFKVDPNKLKSKKSETKI